MTTPANAPSEQCRTESALYLIYDSFPDADSSEPSLQELDEIEKIGRMVSESTTEELALFYTTA